MSEPSNAMETGCKSEPFFMMETGCESEPKTVDENIRRERAEAANGNIHVERAIVDDRDKGLTYEYKHEFCVICDADISYGHNAEPLKAGRCCDACNMTHVLPFRLRLMME
jgi:hypothetical protein